MGGQTTYFLYDGGLPLCELDGGGNVVATNTWGPDGLLSRNVPVPGQGAPAPGAAASVFYAFDPQGSASLRLDPSGNVLGAYLFDAYGLRTGTDNAADPYAGFLGQWGGYTDAETGLTLLNQRYYDAGQGRFLTRDPLGYAGGMDLYAYAADDPVNLMDPSGLCADDDDGLEWGHLSMRSAHPVMNAGTPENAAFRAWMQASENGASYMLPGVGLGFMGYSIATGSSLLNGQTFSSQARWGMAGSAAFMVAAGLAFAAVDGMGSGLNGADSGITTVIGRMDDLEQFNDAEGIDTWWKSGRIPGPGEDDVTWRENRQWLDERIAAGDTFAIATDPNTLGRVRIPGKPNGYFTWLEYDYLTRVQNIFVYPAY